MIAQSSAMKSSTAVSSPSASRRNSPSTISCGVISRPLSAQYAAATDWQGIGAQPSRRASACQRPLQQHRHAAVGKDGHADRLPALGAFSVEDLHSHRWLRRRGRRVELRKRNDEILPSRHLPILAGHAGQRTEGLCFEQEGDGGRSGRLRMGQGACLRMLASGSYQLLGHDKSLALGLTGRHAGGVTIPGRH